MDRITALLIGIGSLIGMFLLYIILVYKNKDTLGDD